MSSGGDPISVGRTDNTGRIAAVANIVIKAKGFEMYPLQFSMLEK